MGVEATNERRLRRISASGRGLASNANEVGNRISVNNECRVRYELSEAVFHIVGLIGTTVRGMTLKAEQHYSPSCTAFIICPGVAIPLRGIH